MIVKESLEGKKEDLAADEHDRWTRWMKHLFSKGTKNDDGTFTIDKKSVDRWERQMKTKYGDLSKSEKDSDRKEADKTLKIVKE